MSSLEELERRITLLEALVLRIERGSSPPSSLVVPPPNLKAQYVAQPEPPNPRWIPIRHANQRMDHDDQPQYAPCGGIAHYLTVPPYEHQKASIDQIRICPPGEQHWRAPKPGIDPPLCMSCGRMVDPFSNADLDYLSHMRPGQPSSDFAPQSAQPPILVELPSDFPGHTPRASFDVQQDMQHLMTLAREAGLTQEPKNDGL